MSVGTSLIVNTCTFSVGAQNIKNWFEQALVKSNINIYRIHILGSFKF